MIAAIRQLRAGPVRLELADGELRYLFVGEREIVRRIYFAVRFHDKWDTAPNKITKCKVRASADGFDVRLEALCLIGPVDYAWSATVTGAADGTITFHARGAARADCTHIRRTGIQVLLGTPDVVGCSHELTGASGAVTRGAFPALLMPDNLPAHFTSLHYRAPDGLAVGLEFSSTVFGIEDQRNFNESSFKLFSAHAHTYPSLPRGQASESSVVVGVTSAPPELAAQPLRARVGERVAGTRVPRIFESIPATPHTLFYRLNHDPGVRTAAGHTLTWAYTPAINLYDNATFMDNVTTAADQTRTARTWGTSITKLRIDPIHFDSLHPRPTRDPRNTSAFGAAWCAALMKGLTLAAVDEAAFRVGSGSVRALQQTFAEFSGGQLQAVHVSGSRPQPVEAFGLEAPDGRRSLWFVNKTSSPVVLPVGNLSTRWFNLRRNSDSYRWENTSSISPEADGTLSFELSPYEVCALFPA